MSYIILQEWGLQNKGGNKIVMCEVLRTVCMTVWDVILNSLVEVY